MHLIIPLTLYHAVLTKHLGRIISIYEASHVKSYLHNFIKHKLGLEMQLFDFIPLGRLLSHAVADNDGCTGVSLNQFVHRGFWVKFLVQKFVLDGLP